jgi:signal transduction histidine kinase/ActR/RegA family two-component response regulator
MHERKLLIVDDTAEDRAALRRYLEEDPGCLHTFLDEASIPEALGKTEVLRTVKEEFLPMLSHELRTPLTPVLGIVSSTLQDSSLAPDLRETFRLIERNIQIEARLIDDLLDLSRVVAGRFEVQKLPVNLHACIEAAIDICQPALDAKNIAIHTALHAAAPMVAGDFSRLQQVFWNLLRNAAEFTPSGGRVEITTRGEGGQLVTEIRDSGIGIPAGELTKIFEAFAIRAPHFRFGSLGLGLFIARSLTEAHGGTLTARSAGPDQGAVFIATLPALGEAQPEAPGDIAKRLRGKTVLVVEDHEDTRRVLSRALRRRGFGVTAAATAETACAQFISQPADLLICDIGLPDGTGWDVMKRLRERGPVKAIAVSGYATEADLQRSRDAGFLAHITKPVDFPQLESVISKVLSKTTENPHSRS